MKTLNLNMDETVAKLIKYDLNLIVSLKSK